MLSVLQKMDIPGVCKSMKQCVTSLRDKGGIRYVCHAGLIDFAVPIFVEGVHQIELDVKGNYLHYLNERH